MRKLMALPGSHNNLEADLWLNTNLVPVLVNANLLTWAPCDFPYTLVSSLHMQKIDNVESVPPLFSPYKETNLNSNTSESSAFRIFTWD